MSQFERGSYRGSFSTISYNFMIESMAVIKTGDVIYLKRKMKRNEGLINVGKKFDCLVSYFESRVG